MKDLINILGFDHVLTDRVGCIRSTGSSARRTIARCHGMSKILQIGMKAPAFYVIEVISEQYDKMPQEEQIKTIIHELLHIPKNFGGGFRHHDFVNERNIGKMYQLYAERNNIQPETVNPVDKKPKLFRFF